MTAHSNFELKSASEFGLKIAHSNLELQLCIRIWSYSCAFDFGVETAHSNFKFGIETVHSSFSGFSCSSGFTGRSNFWLHIVPLNAPLSLWYRMSTGTEHSFAIGLICNWCHLQVVGDLQKIDFALEFKLSKTLSGLVYFVPYLYGGRSPPL